MGKHCVRIYDVAEIYFRVRYMKMCCAVKSKIKIFDCIPILYICLTLSSYIISPLIGREQWGVEYLNIIDNLYVNHSTSIPKFILKSSF